MPDQLSPRPILDHIVILVSYDDLATLPDHLQNALTVITGGEHADGLTVNKLVILADGSYLEFIAFNKGLDPARRRSHRWGGLEEGRIVDWAYTLPREADFGPVQQRVREGGAGVTYTDPVAGGRIRPDKAVLKWAVASARDAAGEPGWPGDAPFWCLDRTERHLRVPYQEAGEVLEHAKHPSKVRGISKVEIRVSEKHLRTWKPVYEAIHNSGQDTTGVEDAWSFDVHSGATQGSHKISLSALQGTDTKSEIRLTFLGVDESPKTIELLPGLVLDVESA
ncbi:glyoxalase-like domain-containing protein [Dactylonectria estremocensis]|uniref:Glyoxalase-like domain-containing protein n=1 Tax=Dactylonectria estremocensis TaxID=1079267 RepID=A0A9P9JKH3_9HYPO|nr:glyoxalase-like domain-containing protein [Dactylonectria estremocensis]